jgi:hypothetical protein
MKTVRVLPPTDGFPMLLEHNGQTFDRVDIIDNGNVVASIKRNEVGQIEIVTSKTLSTQNTPAKSQRSTSQPTKKGCCW